MTTAKIEPVFLVLTAVGLVPIALVYGLAPNVTMPLLFDIDAADVGTRNIFRAIMGLYLALAAFWLVGAARPALRTGALWSLTLFMGGVGAGRLLSLALDGPPHPLLLFFTGLEALIAFTGAWLLSAGAKQTD